MEWVGWIAGWFIGYLSAVAVYSSLRTSQKSKKAIDTVEVWNGKDDGFWWHKQAANNEIIASSESYSSMQAAIKGAFRANPEINQVIVQDPLESNRIVLREDME